VPFEERGRRTDENVAALRALWEQDRASFDGEFVRFDDCMMSPKPVEGTIPIHVGGHTRVAARRAGRPGDGFFPAKGTHDELAELFATVRSTAEEHGRDPDAIELTTGGNGAMGPGALAEVEALATLGVDPIIVPSFLFRARSTQDLARYGDQRAWTAR
jgi:alkanesulfonate monooxygenase SsuD/methylene tetrahydromethanopterin reductase-like flavin-dependent oxidoreductase (luciferase family)